MLRITETFETGNTVRVRLDGTLDCASLLELEAVCARHTNGSDTLVLLDFAGIVFMNSEAARKLAQLCGDRLEIINCSPFIETLLKTVA